MKFSELKIPSKSAKLLTGHPEDSYKIEKSGENCVLKILDKNRFWSSSSVLIIMTK